MSRPVLFGYAVPLSLRAGERIDFMIHDEDAQSYHAEIVRLFAPDVGPHGPPMREVVVPSVINGLHQGVRQTTRLGSFGVVSNPLPFQSWTGITIAAFVFPTKVTGRPQMLVGAIDLARKAGLGMCLDSGGCLALALGDGEKITEVTSELPVGENQWSMVAVALDETRKTVSFCICQLKEQGSQDFTSVVSDVPLTLSPVVASAPIALAGTISRPDGLPACLYNGKIDRPRIYNRALAGGMCWAQLQEFHDCHEALFAAWDLGDDISGATFRDLGPNQLHGQLINLPTRAVAGFNWDGSEFDWRHAPHQYGAVHFHDDDLYDAGWQSSISLPLPSDLPSGVYALRLRRFGTTDAHVPFFVRPAAGTSAEVAFLVPTATYMAYGNHVSRLTATTSERVTGQATVVDTFDLTLLDHPEFGRSTYDSHGDGSGVCYGSRLRPLLNMRPGGRLWNFCLDLRLIDWLDRQSQVVDVVTDEDLHREGCLCLAEYRVIITGCHPEYYSTKMLDGLRKYINAGGRVMYLGGNGFYWRSAFSERFPGAIEVRRGDQGTRLWSSAAGEDHHSFTGERGGTWRRLGRPPNALVGVGFIAQGFDSGAPYYRTVMSDLPQVAFAFKGISARLLGERSLFRGGAAGLEIDATHRDLGAPESTIVLACSGGHSRWYMLASEELPVNYSGADGVCEPRVRAEIALVSHPEGGAVFSVGSIAYMAGLSMEDPEDPLSLLTRNVLSRFVDPTPLTDMRMGPPK